MHAQTVWSPIVAFVNQKFILLTINNYFYLNSRKNKQLHSHTDSCYWSWIILWLYNKHPVVIWRAPCSPAIKTVLLQQQSCMCFLALFLSLGFTTFMWKYIFFEFNNLNLINSSCSPNHIFLLVSLSAVHFKVIRILCREHICSGYCCPTTVCTCFVLIRMRMNSSKHQLTRLLPKCTTFQLSNVLQLGQQFNTKNNLTIQLIFVKGL